MRWLSWFKREPPPGVAALLMQIETGRNERRAIALGVHRQDPNVVLLDLVERVQSLEKRMEELAPWLAP